MEIILLFWRSNHLFVSTEEISDKIKIHVGEPMIYSENTTRLFFLQHVRATFENNRLILQIIVLFWANNMISDNIEINGGKPAIQFEGISVLKNNSVILEIILLFWK